METINTKSNKNKATHSGSCQACGRNQKLPNGVMSKHGYTVQWGFFEGTCPGAHHQPFELSCGLIKQFIANAIMLRDAVISDQAKLREPVAPGTTKAWVTEYRPYANRIPSGYEDRQTEITMERHEYSSGDGFCCTFRFEEKYQIGGFDDGKLNFYGQSVTTVEQACNIQNGKRADKLQKRIDELNSYIAWQTDRVTNWKIGTLTPIGDKK